MHAQRRAECGLNAVVDDKADLGVESASVLVGCHLNAGHSAVARDLGNVRDERSASAEPHLIGIDKQVLKLQCRPRWQPGGEPDDGVVTNGGPYPALCDRRVRELQHVGMGEQLRAVAVIGE